MISQTKSVELTRSIKKKYLIAIGCSYLLVFVIALISAIYQLENNRRDSLKHVHEEVNALSRNLDMQLKLNARMVRKFIQMLESSADPTLGAEIAPSMPTPLKPSASFLQHSFAGGASLTEQLPAAEQAMFAKADGLLPLVMGMYPHAYSVYLYSPKQSLSYYHNPHHRLELSGAPAQPMPLAQLEAQLAALDFDSVQYLNWTTAYFNQAQLTEPIPTISLLSPIKTSTTQPYYLGLHINLKAVRQHYLANRQYSGKIYLFDQQMNVLFNSRANHQQVEQINSLSALLPTPLQGLSFAQLQQAQQGMIFQGYYLYLKPLDHVPWSMIYVKKISELNQEVWQTFDSAFVWGCLWLLGLVSSIHLVYYYLFIHQGYLLLKHIGRCSQRACPPPAGIHQEWHNGFHLVSDSFLEKEKLSAMLREENQQLDHILAQQNEQLKQMMQQQEQKYAILESLLNAMPDGIIYQDLEFNYLGCNHTAERTFGCTEAELKGLRPEDVLPAEDLPIVAKYNQKVLRERIDVSYQITSRVTKTEQIYLVHKTPFYNHRQQLLGIITIWRNITQDVAAANKLRESEQRYDLAMKAVEDGVWDWDIKQNIAYCNAGFFSMLGYEHLSNEFTFEEYLNYIHPDDLEKFLSVQYDYLDRGDFNEVYTSEFRLRDSQGQYQWVLSRGRVISQDHEGKPLRMMGTHKHITKQKANERQLLEAIQEANLANQHKSEFLANMSHEIRTPMNAILGMLQLALHTQLTEKQRDYLNKASYSARSLLKIINDILDFSKIEAGKLEVEQIPFSLTQVLNHVVDVNSLKAEEKQIELWIYNTIPHDLTFIGDPVRLSQVLINLISNAVKFTQQGEVSVSCEAIALERTRYTIRFSVRDTGIGISKAQQKNLFDAFEQADGSTTRKYGGTGLGLSISQLLVHLMGGSIKISSDLGQGAEFYFTLSLPLAADSEALESFQPEIALAHQTPLVDHANEQGYKQENEQEDEQKNELAPEPTNEYKGRILVVDDNFLNQQVASELLKSGGYQVMLADNGEQAIEKILQHQFDVVLMDIQMPVMDGLMAASILREQHQLHQLPIIAMTAHAMASDKQKSLAAGMNDHITKPIDIKVLFETISRYLAT